jgi:L-threonylcarbamoyladenylate synthase
MAEIGQDIEKAKALLERGELVAVPTETVYGLAGNALNIQAVTRIFQVKNRPHFDPLIIHVPDLDHARHFIGDINNYAEALAQVFWPGPLTLLLKKNPVIPDLVTAGLDTVGVRCPDHILTRQLLSQLSFPLAAPSANPFGYVSPTTPEHVNEQLGERLAYILDGGPCTIGIESTIVGFMEGTPTIYRTGGLSMEKIENIVGKVTVKDHSTSNPKAPGQLASHYAPRKKILVGNIRELLQKYPAHCSAVLTFKENYNSPLQYILSPAGNVDEAAQHLFTALRQLDKTDAQVILAEWVPEEGLGRAINDRLRRASATPARNEAQPF